MNGKQEVKFGEWIEKGFSIFKDNLAVLIIGMLIAQVLGIVTGGILMGPLYAGMCWITLRLIDGGDPKPQPDSVFKGFDYFLESLLFFLVWGIALAIVFIVLSLIPCIGVIFGFIVALVGPVFLMFGPYLIVDRKMRFWPATVESFNMVKQQFFPFLGLYLLASLIGSAGGFVCGAGAIVTMPISVCILGVAYRELSGSGPAATGSDEPAPASGPALAEGEAEAGETSPEDEEPKKDAGSAE